MGLSVYFGENITPIITCDTCGKPIKDIRKSMVGIPRLFGQGTEPVYVFHKGECAPSREEYPNCEELHRFMRHLLGNIRLGRLAIADSQRQIVVDVPEPDGLSECVSNLPW